MHSNRVYYTLAALRILTKYQLPKLFLSKFYYGEHVGQECSEKILTVHEVNPQKTIFTHYTRIRQICPRIVEILCHTFSLRIRKRTKIAEKSSITKALRAASGYIASDV